MKIDIILGFEGEPVLHLIAENPADQVVLESFWQHGRTNKIKPNVIGPEDNRRVDSLQISYPALP